MKQYINVSRYKSKLLVRELADGKENRLSLAYKPSLYVRSMPKDATHIDFYGGPVKKITFGNPYDFSKYLKEYGDLDSEVWGNENIIFQYINETYKDEADLSKVNIGFIDIEVNSREKVGDQWVDGGFPNAEEAKFPITAICQYNSYEKKYHIFTTALWKKEDSILDYANDIVYHFSRDEKELLTLWTKFFSASYPHILTGWNCTFFDIPYIVNRCKILFGDVFLERLSPWGMVDEQENRDTFGTVHTTYSFVGVPIIDMMDAYKKYRYKPRESYTLDFILKAEMPDTVRKIEFTGSHGQLYWEQPQLHTDYCVNDVYGTVEMEKYIQMIGTCLMLSYYAGVNFGDNFSTIKFWENLIYRECESRGIAIPLKAHSAKEDFEGAYVFETVNGFHKNVISFDLTSLYPSIMRQFSISKDVYIDGPKRQDYMNQILEVLKENNEIELYEAIAVKSRLIDYYVKYTTLPRCFTEKLQELGVTMTANCQLFDVTKPALFSDLINKLFKERKANKKTSQNYKQLAKDAEEEIKKRGLKI